MLKPIRRVSSQMPSFRRRKALTQTSAAGLPSSKVTLPLIAAPGSILTSTSAVWPGPTVTIGTVRAIPCPTTAMGFSNSARVKPRIGEG